MKKKKTLQEKLNGRKYKIPNKLLYGALKKIVIDKMLLPKYNLHTTIKDDINKNKGPAFILFNHEARMDYLWTIAAAYPKRVNFMIGYNELFRSHLSFVLKIANVIPKKNFTMDILSLRAVNSLIKQGATIAFAPEGMSSISGHNQPIVVGTGKFLKHYGIPVYMMRSYGAFLTNTKSCLDERKGRIDSELSLLFSKEDLEKYKPEEIDEIINKEFTHDEYEWNKKEQIHFETHGRICKDLHYLCYKCPSCGEEFMMEDKDNTISCKKCGYSLSMDDTYAFHPNNEESKVIYESPSIWFDHERYAVIKEIRKDDKYSFKEHVKLGKLDEYKTIKDMKTSVLCGEGDLIVDHDGLHYRGSKDGKEFNFDLSYEEIYTLGMPTDTSYVAVYHNGNYYDIYPERPVSIKILHLVEEMHRLHVNTWKALPNEQWMYE